jgi:2,4-dienoyl-CoA reductase-like NADH-dependent reductase (Old Yellow Enzyme family)
MPGLFDPIKIKGLSLKNRIVMPPMATGMATEEGEITERHINHYISRAKGGVGLIIIEHTYVSEDGKAHKGQLGLYNDRLISGLKHLVETIHAKGTKIIIQLTHVGAATSCPCHSLSVRYPS